MAGERGKTAKLTSNFGKAVILGHFDGFNGVYLHGWLLDALSPDNKRRVEILEGETLLASGLANKFHGGLKEEGIGDGNNGFLIPLPAVLLDGRPHVLRARDAETGVFIQGEVTVSVFPPQIGVVEAVFMGRVIGWVNSSENDPEIEIRLDGNCVSRILASINRDDIESFHPAFKVKGFSCDISSYLNEKSNPLLEVVETSSGLALENSGVRLLDKPVWGAIDRNSGVELSGWAVSSHRSNLTLECMVDGYVVDRIKANLPRPDLLKVGFPYSRCGFRWTLPPRYMDGDSHEVEIVEPESGILVGREKVSVKIDYCIDLVTEDRIKGWIMNSYNPHNPIHLDVYLNRKKIKSIVADIVRPDVLDRDGNPVRCGFFVQLPQLKEEREGFTVRLSPKGYKDSITGKDIVVVPTRRVIEELEKASRKYPLLRWGVEKWLVNTRNEYMKSPVMFREVLSTESADDIIKVDVIIPVYRGREETISCIKSIIRSKEENVTAFELIVIDDASPDFVLVSELKRLSKELDFTFLSNPENKGFVATVNRGIKLHPWRDVIILNSDTLVPNSNWLDRLRKAAYSDERIATVTPFSNKATILSFPACNLDNDLPENFTVEDIDRLFAQENENIVVDIPTGVGFCMYIRREALRETGLLDEKTWGKGYGEENDFCVRSAALGWRHVAACDVFIMHRGSISFGAEKSLRIKENLRKLESLYPDYSPRVAEFLKKDPLWKPRARVAVHLLRNKAKGYIIHVLHGWGGGALYHVLDLVASSKNKADAYLILQPGEHECIELKEPKETADSIKVNFPRGTSIEEIAYFIRQLPIKHFHFHQTIGLPPSIWELPEILGVPYEVTIHDFTFICPRISLLNDKEQFCGQPEEAVCEDCVNGSPLPPGISEEFEFLGGTVKAWRSAYFKRLSRASKVTAPCKDAAYRINRYYQGLSIRVRPHEKRFSPKISTTFPVDGELRVAIIGAIGPHKGHELLLKVVQFSEKEDLPIKFFIVGYTYDDKAYETFSNVEILGRYERRELPQILSDLRCHVALFLSQLPETYSYTLSEAWRAGLLPVVTGLGALQERVNQNKCGIVLSSSPTVEEVINVLKGLIKQTSC